MKRKVIVRLAGAGALLIVLGALAVETVNQLYVEPRTISSWGELLDCYLVARTSLPPLPFTYEDALSKMESGDWSFLADHWQVRQADGTYYVAEKSKLAKLKLPLHILVYEDLQRGDIIILSSIDGEKYQGEALFKAPEFMPYEQGVPVDIYAFEELAPRRVVWEITLKSEADAWAELLTMQAAASRNTSALTFEDGMMTMMSVPAEHTNDIWLALETLTNGINLNVFAPEGFTNRVEVYSCTNLVSGLWRVAAQNLYPSTNPAVWDASSMLSNRFLRVGNMDIDSDEDGINDARELIVHHTLTNEPDSDFDTISDYQEIYVDHTDPNNDDISLPSVTIIKPFGIKTLTP